LDDDEIIHFEKINPFKLNKNNDNKDHYYMIFIYEDPEVKCKELCIKSLKDVGCILK
jgi:hypothetical protein